MNINISIDCDTCGETTNCRIGLSARYVRPLRFSCQDCGSAIDISLPDPEASMIGKKRPFIAGGQQIPGKIPFDHETNFVDLHQDFPVSFEKYVMGHTPFLRASQRIGFEEMQLHGARLSMLDHQYTLGRDFKNLLKLYARDRARPFRLNVERVFEIGVRSERLQDINAALYTLIAKMMWPFAYPGDNEDASALSAETVIELGETKRQALDAFVNELRDNGFLKKLQLDCLEIYPRILDAEIALRPALFLDFDEEYAEELTPMRVSVDEFEMYKDLYKDIAEIVGRQIILIAGINNLQKRGDHNQFKPGIGLSKKSGNDHTPANLDDFANLDVGKKLDFIDDNWCDFLNDGANNQLRNAIAHYKTDYDDVSQIITYFPRKEGMKEDRSEHMYFLEFMKRILTVYREMHNLHHLIKAMYYYEYLIKNEFEARDSAH